MAFILHTSVFTQSSAHVEPGVHGGGSKGGQPGIRVASRMACISSDTSSGLFCVKVPSVKNGPDKCLVRGACAARGRGVRRGVRVAILTMAILTTDGWRTLSR